MTRCGAITMGPTRKPAGLAAAMIAAAVSLTVFTRPKPLERVADDAASTRAVYGPISQTVDATGSIVPQSRVEIKPAFGGRVERLLAAEGDKVAAGEILGWISSTDRAAILDAARATGAGAFKTWQQAYRPSPIVSPISGVVVLRGVVEGQTVDVSSVVYAVADLLIAYAKVDESDVDSIRIGQRSIVTLDSDPAKPLRGTVFGILQEGSNSSGIVTYGAKIRLDRVPPGARSQMTINAAFETAHKGRALLLPADAVQTLPDDTRTVSVPAAGGGAVSLAVATGLENDDQVEILSGLSEGDVALLPKDAYVPQDADDAESSPLAFSPPKRDAFEGRAPKPGKGSASASSNAPGGPGPGGPP
jgi:macrolide-specific efflux system membrane fusion protein